MSLQQRIKRNAVAGSHRCLGLARWREAGAPIKSLCSLVDDAFLKWAAIRRAHTVQA